MADRSAFADVVEELKGRPALARAETIPSMLVSSGLASLVRVPTLAALPPARRTMRSDPAVVLRQE